MSPVLSVLYSQDCHSFLCFSKLKLTLTSFADLLEECVDQLSFPLKPSKLQNLSRCRAAAVIITKGFLTFLERNHDFAYKIACCLRPSKTVAFLLGVREWDIQCFHKTILASYCSWKRFIVNQGDTIPPEAFCAIRLLVSGSGENIIETQETNTDVESMEPLQVSDKTEDIQQKQGTMKNATPKETKERCQTSEKDRKFKMQDFSESNAQKMKASSKISGKKDVLQKETIPENAESSETTGATSDVEEETTALPKSFKRKKVVKKRKTVIKVDGTFPQMKDVSEKKIESRKIQDDTQEEAMDNKTEKLKHKDVGKRTAKECTESEKSRNIQEATETSELLKTSDHTERQISALEKAKNTGKSKRGGMKKRKTPESLKKTDSVHLESLQQLNKDGSKENVVKESVEILHTSSGNNIQEQNDIQVQATETNMKSSKISRTTDDIRENQIAIESGSKTSGKAGDNEKKKLKSTESSKSLKGKDGKKKKKKAEKNNEISELRENTEGSAANDSESLEISGTTEDNQEKEVKTAAATSQIFGTVDNTSGEVPNEDTQTSLTEDKTENIEDEIPTEIVIVPQRIDKDNDCVFLIFTSLLKNLENIYVLLERNILKETPIHLLNPYVVFFFVPEQFLSVQGNVNVHIRHENRLLDVKRLCIVSELQAPCRRLLVSEATSPLDFPPALPFQTSEDDVTLIQTDNEEVHPSDGSDFSKTGENEFGDGTVRSFLKFFAHYGFGELDELALELLTEENVEEQAGRSSATVSRHEVLENVTPRESISHKKETVHRGSLVLPSISFERVPSDLRRSESLPLLLSANPTEEHIETGATGETDEDRLYMEMSTGYSSGKRPHEILLDELLKRGDSDYSRLNSLSSNIYVSMKLSLEGNEDDEAAEMELSKSQQELLQLLKAFKHGDKTLSQVEGLFKEWVVKHQDSLEEKDDVTFRHADGDTVRKERKRQSFSLIDIMRLIPGITKKKTKIKGQPQDAKARQKTDKRQERSVKTLSKISNSSASSASSLCGDTHLLPFPANQEHKRDSGNHSDSNEDSRNKMLTEDEKSTKWFIIPPPTSPICFISSEGTPPSLPSRPPPSVQNSNEKRPNLPTRLPPKLCTPPVLPPKPAALQKAASSSAQDQTTKKKKSKSKDPQVKMKKTQRDASPDYITAKSHPRSPPKTRDQFKQAVQPTPAQTRRNNYALERLRLSPDPPRKSSAPDIRTDSNYPRNVTNISSISRTAASPFTSQKEHHSRYNKPLIPNSRRSSSCPNLHNRNNRDENTHTYIVLQGEAEHDKNKSYLHSSKSHGTKLADPPPLPPR